MHDDSCPELSGHHDTVMRVYAEEIISAFLERMKEAERLAGELHDLMTNYGADVEGEGASVRAETLMRWAKDYGAGLSAAGKISRNGEVWLRGLNQRLNVESPSERPQRDRLLLRNGRAV